MSGLPELTPISEAESFKYTPADILKSWSNIESAGLTEEFDEVLKKTNQDSANIHALWLEAQNNATSLAFQMEYIKPEQVTNILQKKAEHKIFQNQIIQAGLAGFRLRFANSFDSQKLQIRLGRGIGYIEVHFAPDVEGLIDLEIDSHVELKASQAILMTQYFLKENAKIRIQERVTGCQANAVRIFNAQLAKESHLKHLIQSDQSPFYYFRNQVRIDLNGHGAQAQLLASVYQKAHQIFESETWIHHNCPETLSNQLYKAAVSDEARNICLAHVKIAEGASGSSASQMIKALMLSHKAKVDYKPFLDIHCDDVKATHGAAISCFQEEELFYLASRGIKPDESVQLLENAFLNEVEDVFNG